MGRAFSLSPDGERAGDRGFLAERRSNL